MNNDIAERRTGTALATYDEKWEQQSKKAAAAEPLQAGTWLSAKGGQLAIGDEILPGEQAALIILDSISENTFYQGRYDPDNPMPPICYAFGRDGEDMAPHVESMIKDQDYFLPQHIVQGKVLGCDGCPMNEWGSADQGRGKACQNRRRLAVIPAGYYQTKRGSRDFDLHLFTEREHFERAEVAFFKLSVTSVKNWANYVHQLASVHRRPPHGVVTRLSIVPHQSYQYEAIFEPIEMVPDDLADIIMQRSASLTETPFQGYQAPTPEQAAGNTRGGFRQGGRQQAQQGRR